MDKLIELFKGMGIGIANIIPGFSGGTMAVVFNLYEKLIYAFSHFFESPVQTLKELWAVLIGVILGIFIAVFGITTLLDAYPVPTLLLFVGMVLGSIPKVQKRTNVFSGLTSTKVALVLGFLLLITLTFLPSANNIDSGKTNGFIVGFFLISAIGSTSMVIPGISGSLIFLIFGYYDFVLELVIEFIRGILTMNITLIGDTVGYVILLVLGSVLGIVLIAKQIERLLLSHKSIIYAFIVGLLLATPVAIISNMIRLYPTQISEGSLFLWTAALLAFLLGFLGAYYLGKKEHSETIENISNPV